MVESLQALFSMDLRDLCLNSASRCREYDGTTTSQKKETGMHCVCFWTKAYSIEISLKLASSRVRKLVSNDRCLFYTSIYIMHVVHRTGSTGQLCYRNILAPALGQCPLNWWHLRLVSFWLDCMYQRAAPLLPKLTYLSLLQFYMHEIQYAQTAKIKQLNLVRQDCVHNI